MSVVKVYLAVSKFSVVKLFVVRLSDVKLPVVKLFSNTRTLQELSNCSYLNFDLGYILFLFISVGVKRQVKRLSD